jgi:hypothetical protein
MLAEGHKLVSGGVEIPHTKGCLNWFTNLGISSGLPAYLASSPVKIACYIENRAWRQVTHVLCLLCVLVCAGDVLLHTVTDAILGALSLPDIGETAAMAAALCRSLQSAKQSYPDCSSSSSGSSSVQCSLKQAAAAALECSMWAAQGA